jgi:hypothetical protein
MSHLLICVGPIAGVKTAAMTSTGMRASSFAASASGAGSVLSVRMFVIETAIECAFMFEGGDITCHQQ